jgi:moderate conductance mechanosensitive channel
VLWLAQTTVAELCGEGEDAVWLCEVVFELTGNEALSRTARIGSTFVAIVTILVVAWLLQRLAKRLVLRFDRRMEEAIKDRLQRAVARGAMTETGQFRTRRFQRLHATTGVMNGAVGAVIWITAILVILARLNVPLQPVLAGAGVAGLIIGFGAQQLVRDVLAGIAMLIEDQYGVGDWIEVEGKIGTVERVGLRSTAFRDVDGTVHHVLNGYIQRVGNLSQHWARATFDVPLALDADVPAAKALIHKVATDLAHDPVWGEDIIDEPEIWGMQHFGPDGIQIRVVIKTKPLRNWDVMRQLRERLKHAFERAGIRQPSQLVDLGGQYRGYPVLNRDLAEDTTAGPPRRRGLVPPDVSPLDRPAEPAHQREPVTQDRPEEAPADEDADRTRVVRDETTELRIDRGPEPRPD